MESTWWAGKVFFLFNFDFLVLPVNIWLVDIGPVEEEEPDNYLVVVQDSLQESKMDWSSTQ